MKREEQVFRRVGHGDITFLKAAATADITVWDVAALLNEEDVPWIDGDHVEADLRDL